ncbi:hypothetical protein [Methylobacterium litchii]
MSDAERGKRNPSILV